MGRYVAARTGAMGALAAIALGLVPGTAVAGSVNQDIGYNDLVARLGAGNVPTGAGVFSAQVEAPESPGNYGPNTADPQFAGKNFIPMSGPSGSSGHATLVGQLWYGNTSSIAPGITNIWLYEASSFLQGAYLRTGSGTTVPPLIPPAGVRIFNNSWVGSVGAFDNEALRRADFAIERDKILMVNGMNNGGGQNVSLMSHGFNGLAVGVDGGTHVSGPTPGNIDGPGRMKPEIVAPGQFTSFAAPLIDASAALMMHTVAATPALATNVNATRPEVIKAVLLGGATHRQGWTNNPATSGPDRGLTLTPLDPVYGVDLVNVNTSHLILTGLEQDGSAAFPAMPNIQEAGWDLASVPMGGNVYYRFNITQTAPTVIFTATWNRQVSGTFGSFASANFDLLLKRVDQAGLPVSLLGDAGQPYFTGGNVVSQSAVDNIEHVVVRNLQPGAYVMHLKRNDGLSGNRDIALTWIMPEQSPTNPADINGDGSVNVSDLLMVINHWGACPNPCPPTCDADVNNDCSVSVSDLLMVINAWG